MSDSLSPVFDPRQWKLGTMGFSYEDWSGPFYPDGLAKSDWLSFYARHFNAVELDTTFHAAPDAQRVRRWASVVPDDFRFCAKTPRAVTHDVPLDRAVEPMREFLDVMREMGDKLSAVLIQFAPSFMFDEAPRLEAFLHALPRDIPLAVELRNRTWGTPRTLELLKAANCCLVSAEYLSRPRRIFLTSDLVYVRWIGEHERYPTHTAEQADLAESLQWWKTELLRVSPRAREICGFFNNDYTGYSIGTCNRFKEMLGLPVTTPQGQQGELFP